MFPQQINQGASRNRDLVREAAEITAYETRASGIPWTFSPVLDLGSDPRFPRLFETFGADPYLVSELGKEMVDGYEGEQNTIGDKEHVASTMKHFLGYQVTASGKDRTPASISAHALREYHIPPFKEAIEAGSHTVMVNSGIINGVPVHASKDLLTEKLKKEMGFQGIVLTDWADIENLHNRDKVASSIKEAIKVAINAGVDMSMVPYQYEAFTNGLVELVKEGEVAESRINDAVSRILKVKLALDLFETPVTNYENYPKFGSDAFEQAAYDMAAESITLLKNKDDILPLSKDTEVLVTGPNANSMRTLNGAWTYSWQGDKVEEFAGEYNTILEAIENEIGAENVTHVPGVQYNMDGQYFEQDFAQLEKAVAEAKKADMVILVVGENSVTEKPGDLNDLYLASEQTELAQKIAATGTPVVLVLNENRPRIISKFERDNGTWHRPDLSAG
ncbi:MAG: glycoside hydrolase family 3 N-terminal domain-containing protein [Fodinibius sp.]|nr:glycoside hydrolase family 3 N-terminal domain-containing protein [Fodinibius sp.]